jgi:uncharacterized lipoprotein YajG
MKQLLLLVAVVLLTGCMSSQTVRTMIDEKIAANNNEYIQPALAEQRADLTALEAEVKRNSLAIGASKAAILKHQDVLLDAFRKQQKAAEDALDLLAPAPEPAPPAAPGE